MKMDGMSDLQRHIINALLYFDIFSFPLTSEEIRRYCGIKVGDNELHSALKALVEEKQIYWSEGYYLASNRPELIPQRKRKFHYSRNLMQTARRNARIISLFPFVKGVAISGSLSKFSADEKADIDFFIITASRRLWICRSFLHLFKKTTYLWGGQHDFCMNYFLDEGELELKDKNFYTAVESISIIPVFGKDTIRAFLASNAWVSSYFPNFVALPSHCEPIFESHPFAKRLLEVPFSKKVGHLLNAFLFRVTVRWWRLKFRKNGFPMEYFDRDLRSTNGESKYHPNDYQRSILSTFQQKKEQFFKNNSVPDHWAPEHRLER